MPRDTTRWSTEQTLNIVTHGLAAILVPILFLTLKEHTQPVWVMYSCFFVLFLTSCVYHYTEETPYLQLMLRMDMSMVTLSIAATVHAHATTIPELTVYPSMTTVIVVTDWVLAAANVVLTFCFGWKAARILLSLYVLQVAFPFLFATTVSGLLVPRLIAVELGVLAYGIGLFRFFIYQHDKDRYLYHVWWHICVILGFSAHHAAIAIAQV